MGLVTVSNLLEITGMFTCVTLILGKACKIIDEDVGNIESNCCDLSHALGSAILYHLSPIAHQCITSCGAKPTLLGIGVESICS